MRHTAAQAFTTPLAAQKRHQSFPQVVLITICIWYLYRFLFQNPVWFDESIGKLIFFALPVWLYIVISQTQLVQEALSPSKMFKGLYLGLAFGGLFGFVSLFAAISGKTAFYAAPVFLVPQFWGEFFLALLTGFWESLFFFGWIFQITQAYFKRFGLFRNVVVCGLIFVLFHVPNALLRFDTSWGIPFGNYFFSQVLLLFFFSIGQALMFVKYRNVYLLTLTHALWGMVLLVYSR